MVRRILVRAGCGFITSLEVPLEMTDEQFLAQFIRGQLIAASIGLLIGISLLLAVIFVG